MFGKKLSAFGLSALVTATVASSSRGAIITSLSDTFSGTSVDSSKWNTTDRGLEFTGPAGYNAPSESGGTLTLSGTTNHSYWAGSSLESVNSFSSSVKTYVQVERVSLSGSGDYRSSLWLYGDGSNFIHFAQDIGESNWEINCNGCNGYATPTNVGTTVLNSNDPGDHIMKLVFTPSGGTDVKIGVFLDNLAVPLATVDFPNWTPSSFTTILTGQARQSGDSVSAVFDNFNAIAPEPASIGLLGVGGLGLLARRRRA